MPALPPLIDDRPPALRFGLMYVTPVLGGVATGATLGLSVAAWAIANLIATLGGLGAGFDHRDRRAAVRRGAIGGLLFGLGVVAADAVLVDDRVTAIADPPILQAVVTTIAGTLLALAGCALRVRAERRAAAAAA